ncbi:MAG: hypothetical protein JWO66_1671, partial [Candidatus Eremiobacteraeota bacterium]|nr:hypothetical protein [Candidatus Eremiobacteraeota bacterium]
IRVVTVTSHDAEPFAAVAAAVSDRVAVASKYAGARP